MKEPKGEGSRVGHVLELDLGGGMLTVLVLEEPLEAIKVLVLEDDMYPENEGCIRTWDAWQFRPGSPWRRIA